MAKRETQAETNYDRGNPINHCGICTFYNGHHRCSMVMGDISPYGICTVFNADKNPFGATLAPNEVAAIKAMAADAQDRSQGGGAPGGPAQPMPPRPMPPQQAAPPRPFFGG